jgi:hypothetical protein
MICRDWEERIALYAGGDAGAAEAAAVEKHLAECAGCQLALSGLRQSMEILQEAHREPVEEAHLTAVRARVLAEIAGERRPWWRQVWVYGAVVAAAVAITIVGLRPATHRPVDVAVVTPAETVKPPATALPEPAAVPPVHKRAHVRAARKVEAPIAPPAGPVRAAASEPLLVKLITDDPDVVIYWISDGSD